MPGLTLDIPKCDRSHQEIQELRAQNETLIMLLPKLTLPVLAQMHPNLAGHWTVQPSSGIERDLHFGWLAIEDSTKSPNLGSDEAMLKEVAKKTGEHGMTLQTYYVGSMDHYDRKGEYFDHGFQTFSRLLGSRHEGHVLYADFNSLGWPRVLSDLAPQDRDDDGGGRFEGVKK